MADRKMDRLMILIISIVVIHSVLTAYWIILHKSYFRRPDIYEQKAKIQDEHNQQVDYYVYKSLK